MEKLLHFTWMHRLFPLSPLRTTKDEAVEIIDPGLYNKNGGPDFFNAKIKIDNTVWVGNIEIHIISSDWYKHGHDKDENYNNVILHVVEKADKEVFTENGRQLPQLEIPISKTVIDNYQELLRTENYPPCYKVIPQIKPIVVDNWLASLVTERLEHKSKRIMKIVEETNGDWKKAYFVTLARNFGFGVNGEAFEEWAKSISLISVGKHRNNLFQIEAFFMGQAGLLAPELPKITERKTRKKEDYYTKLSREYLFLAHKFTLTAIDKNKWRFLRLRPQNFPYIRISQLANLFYKNNASISKILEAKNVNDLMKCLSTQVTPYWRKHYNFKKESKENWKRLQKASLFILIINTVCPLLFAYGRYHCQEKLCERSFKFLEELNAENNYITRSWKMAGIAVKNATDSQALIELRKEYCEKKDCLRCRFGYEFLKSASRKEVKQ